MTSSAILKHKVKSGSAKVVDYIELAAHETNMGNLDRARELAKIAVDKQPNNLNALNAYVTATKVKAGDPVLVIIEKLTKVRNLLPAQASLLYFMYAKCLDDTNEYQKAFEYFSKANTASQKTYNSADTDNFARKLMDAVAGIPKISALPSDQKLAFIIGMPRSGSSLMAQCLAGHDQIRSMGEVSALGQSIDPSAARGDRTGAISPLQFIHGLTKDRLKQAQDTYLQLIEGHVGGGDILIDKMPENYWMAWLIPLIFPNALILHAQRTPIATCWSCYRNDFKYGHTYSYDQETMAAHYRNYQRLMAQFQPTAGDNWIDVRLEDLSADPQATLTPILSQLGLDWQDGCLRPDKVSGPVATLSKWQVRQPVKPQLAARWKNYLPYLRDMQDFLDQPL